MTPVRREGYKFCQDICIPCYDTDARANLRPSAFMDFAQEIAYWAASELGFGYDTLHVHHTAWVLTRMHIHFEEPLKWRDNVTLYTWHKGASGLFYLRDFDLRDSSGKSRVKARGNRKKINDDHDSLTGFCDRSTVIDDLIKKKCNQRQDDLQLADPYPIIFHQSGHYVREKQKKHCYSRVNEQALIVLKNRA